ncbi:MAG: radical SAM protein [Vicinamibacterales bacterium]
MIILYNPVSSAGRKPVLPMSLLAVGAVLESHVDYAIVDGNVDPSPLDTMSAQIRERGVRVVGMTVMPGPQLADALRVARALKARHPELTVVWGGYFPTQHADACLADPAVDVVVRGHGEHACLALVQRLDRGEPLDGIPGVVDVSSMGPDGLRASPPIAPIPHPQELPDFPYERVDMERYVRSSFMGRRTLSHHSSYGCPFTCNFCAVVNMVEGRWLAQRPERVAQVVRRLVADYRADAIEFYDNNFFVDESRVLDVAQRIAGLGIGWWGEGRIDTMLKFSPRTWSVMRQSGLRMVYLGAESGSDETLKRMNKGGTASTDQTMAIASVMRSNGIIPEFSFVVGNPPDPLSDVESTIRFIRRLKRESPESEIVLYMYTPVPLAGTLYDDVRRQGFEFPRTLDEWTSPQWRAFSERRSRHLDWVDRRAHRRVRDFERVLHARFPTVTDPALTGLRRRVPEVVSRWRYRFGIYGWPVELKLLHRYLPYQRPETSGF